MEVFGVCLPFCAQLNVAKLTFDRKTSEPNENPIYKQAPKYILLSICFQLMKYTDEWEKERKRNRPNFGWLKLDVFGIIDWIVDAVYECGENPTVLLIIDIQMDALHANI